MKILPKRFYNKEQPGSDVIVLKPVKRVQLPSISLIIPEDLLKHTLLSPVFLTAFTCGFLFMAIGIVGYDARNNASLLSTAKKERSSVELQIRYWKGILNQYKGYRDGYYQLALLEYRIGNLSEAFEYNNKALDVDPSFKEARLLAEKIVGE